MRSLHDRLGADLVNIPFKVSSEIRKNLNPAFPLRPYQQEAFTRFHHYWNHYRPKEKPARLLFHMATGSGKTLLMAGFMLSLYRQGFRNFIFFVNSTSIIEKTKDNFLNPSSSKYLFAPEVFIHGRKITVKEASHFQGAHSQDLQIVFTTIQGLHTTLNNPRENALTYEDLSNDKVVLLSDEAHHINAETREGKKTEKKSETADTWERTVSGVLKANPRNCLLEFTATADLAHPGISKKYRDLLVFDYSLHQFHKDGYSKAVKVLQAESPPFQRALQAAILSQYRRKIFEKNGKTIKPVMLLKSKTIAQSKDFFQRFATGIQRLSSDTIQEIRFGSHTTALQEAFSYFRGQGITPMHLAEELREDFSPGKCLSVNSKNDSFEKQLILNSLEDESNEFRAIFAVDMLNEGWDVLNLFDIVRLYDTAHTTQKEIAKTTLSEAQLIGRGARYCPFQITQVQPLYQRKYDEDPSGELRICETLYYHASYNPGYIAELNKALTTLGLKSRKSARSPVVNHRPWKRSLLKQKARQSAGAATLKRAISGRLYHYSLPEEAQESELLDRPVRQAEKIRQHFYIHSFGQPIIRKAINSLTFYRFDNLKQYFPGLKSLSEFITSDDFLKPVKVTISGSPHQLQHLSSLEKLQGTFRVLDDISRQLELEG